MTEAKHIASEVETDLRNEPLHFDVSTGLKRVIGRDLDYGRRSSYFRTGQELVRCACIVSADSY